VLEGNAVPLKEEGTTDGEREGIIQAVTHGGTTTRPRAAIPRPAMIEADMTCPSGFICGKR